MVGRMTLVVGMMAMLISASAAESVFVTWDVALARMRSANPVHTVIYVGHRETKIRRLLDREQWRPAGMQLTSITANERVMNPFTNTPILGSEFIGFFAGVVQDYAAGSFFFLDARGILVPNLVLPYLMHRNRLPVIQLYAEYAKSGLAGKMSMVEFATLNGLGEIAKTLALELAQKQHENMAWMLRTYSKEQPFLIAMMANGQAVNPKQDTALFVITKDPNGLAFVAQVSEMWRKLTVITSQGASPPPLVIIGPAGAQYPALDAMGIRYKAATATADMLRPLATPTVMIPSDGGGREAQAITGFLPGEVIAVSLSIPVQDRTAINPDVPIGEVDYDAGEDALLP